MLLERLELGEDRHHECAVVQPGLSPPVRLDSIIEFWVGLLTEFGEHVWGPA